MFWTWFVVILLGALVLGFAYLADVWHRRADFWERRYLAALEHFDVLDDYEIEALAEMDTEWRA